MGKKFAASITDCVQIGIEKWKDKKITKVFSYESSMGDVISWAESCGFKDPEITDIEFSQLDED